MLYSRVAEHRGYVNNMLTDKSPGQHFNSPGHSLSDMEVTVLEQNKGKWEEYSKEREHYLFENFTRTTEVSTNRKSLLEGEDLVENNLLFLST